MACPKAMILKVGAGGEPAGQQKSRLRAGLFVVQESRYLPPNWNTTGEQGSSGTMSPV